MKRMFCSVAAVLVFFSSSTFGSAFSLQFSAQTDGNLYTTRTVGDADPEESIDFVGIQHIAESATLNWHVESVFMPPPHDAGTRTFYIAESQLSSSSLSADGGLLMSWFPPMPNPDTQESLSEVYGGVRWIDYHDPALPDRSGVQFDFAVTVYSSMHDDNGLWHRYGYSRVYTLFNNALIASSDEVGEFTVALFEQLLASPTTSFWYTETVSEYSLRCVGEDPCIYEEMTQRMLDGTFSLIVDRAVPTPETVMLLGLGFVLLLSRLKHKTT